MITGSSATEPILVTPKIHHYSQRMVEGIKVFENYTLAHAPEGFVDKARYDRYGKCHEVGYGFTSNLIDAAIRFKVLGKGYVLPRTMTKLEADAFLINVAIPTCHKLVKHYTDGTLTIQQRDALIMFVYNLGEASLSNLKIKDETSLKDAPSKMLQYTRAGGQVLKGLIKRRVFEINLFKNA